MRKKQKKQVILIFSLLLLLIPSVEKITAEKVPISAASRTKKIPE